MSLPTTKVCASGSTLVTIFVFMVVTCCSSCTVPVAVYIASPAEISVLPGSGVSFVELLVSLYVFFPVRILGFGAGVVCGSLIKNDPNNEPLTSEISLKSLTYAIAPLDCPTILEPFSIYPLKLPCASDASATRSMFMVLEDWLYPEGIFSDATYG